MKLADFLAVHIPNNPLFTLIEWNLNLESIVCNRGVTNESKSSFNVNRLGFYSALQLLFQCQPWLCILRLFLASHFYWLGLWSWSADKFKKHSMSMLTQHPLSPPFHMLDYSQAPCGFFTNSFEGWCLGLRFIDLN